MLSLIGFLVHTVRMSVRLLGNWCKNEIMNISVWYSLALLQGPAAAQCPGVPRM